jgi:hypothetical protein
MKNIKLMPCNRIGLFQDSDGNEFEDLVLFIAFYKDGDCEDFDYLTSFVTESDLTAGGVTLNELKFFVRFK